MKVSVAALVVALLSGAGIASLVGGCGGGSTHTGSVTVGANGTIYIGTSTITTRTRTVQGTTETLYIRHGPVSTANTRHVIVERLPRVGMVLTNGKGYALYAFVPGERSAARCTGACATRWPPIRLNIEMAIDSSPALDESNVSTEPDPEHHEAGDRLVKFAGHVLHSYTGDTSPGAINGEGLESYGGHWYLISPAGALIK